VSGILKSEGVVRPPSNNNDAIPGEATAKTIKPSDRILFIIVCIKDDSLNHAADS
jgi:hypothetical protein